MYRYLPMLVAKSRHERMCSSGATHFISQLTAFYLSVNDSVQKGDRFNEVIDQLAALTSPKNFPELAAIHLEPCTRKPENAGRLEWLKHRCEEAGV
jgi:hypothetical protein